MISNSRQGSHWMLWLCVCILGLQCVSVFSEPQGKGTAGSIRVDLRAPESVRLGEPLEVEVAYWNIGQEPLLLDRTLGVGRATDLRVYAVADGCHVEVPDAFIETARSWEPFFATALIPGRGLTEKLRFNDIAGMWLEFPIRAPGTYQVVARLSKREGSEPRAWAGTAESAPVRVSVLPAREEAVSAWRHTLEECLDGDCDNVEGAMKYFSLVRDEQAAEYLLALLGKKVGGAAHALAAQGRKKDVQALREYARRQSVPATQEYYLQAAAEIERGERCTH